MGGFKMTQENEQNNHCSFQREWNEWAEEQFSEEKIEEASENISDILARQKQKERGPIALFDF